MATNTNVINGDLYILNDPNNPISSRSASVNPSTTLDQVYDQNDIDTSTAKYKTLRKILSELEDLIRYGGDISFPVTSVNGKSAFSEGRDSDIVITAADVGLGNVENVTNDERPLGTRATTDVKHVIENLLGSTIDAIEDHIRSTSNPHGVNLNTINADGSLHDYIVNLITDHLNNDTDPNGHVALSQLIEQLKISINDGNTGNAALSNRIDVVNDLISDHRNDENAHASLFANKEDIIRKVNKIIESHASPTDGKYPTVYAVVEYIEKIVKVLDAPRDLFSQIEVLVDYDQCRFDVDENGDLNVIVPDEVYETLRDELAIEGDNLYLNDPDDESSEYESALEEYRFDIENDNLILSTTSHLLPVANEEEYKKRIIYILPDGHTDDGKMEIASIVKQSDSNGDAYVWKYTVVGPYSTFDSRYFTYDTRNGLTIDLANLSNDIFSNYEQIEDTLSELVGRVLASQLNNYYSKKDVRDMNFAADLNLQSGLRNGTVTLNGCTYNENGQAIPFSMNVEVTGLRSMAYKDNVQADDIANGAISNIKIGSREITGDKIAKTTITAENLSLPYNHIYGNMFNEGSDVVEPIDVHWFADFVINRFIEYIDFAVIDNQTILEDVSNIFARVIGEDDPTNILNFFIEDEDLIMYFPGIYASEDELQVYVENGELIFECADDDADLTYVEKLLRDYVFTIEDPNLYLTVPTSYNTIPT